MSVRLDDVDYHILDILLDDATISRAEIARKVGVAAPTLAAADQPASPVEFLSTNTRRPSTRLTAF
jgi:hypothetical protein